MAKAACNAGNILYTTLTIELSKDVVGVGGTVTATVTTDPSVPPVNVTLTSVSSKISITPTVGLPGVFTITGDTESDAPKDVPLVATIISGVETDPEVVSCIETSSITVLKVDIVGCKPGTMSVPGAEVSETDEDDAFKLLSSVNDDNEDGGPAGQKDNRDTIIGGTDNDIVRVTLKRLAPPVVSDGTMELTVTGAADVRIFKNGGAALLVDYSVDLAAPSGDLAALASGDLDIYLEGLQANGDVVLKLAYKNTSGAEIASDRLHLTVLKVDLTEIKGLRKSTVGDFTQEADAHATGRLFIDTKETWGGGTLDSAHYDKQRVKLTVEVQPNTLPPGDFNIRWEVRDPDDPATHTDIDANGSGGDNAGKAHEGESYWFTQADHTISDQANATAVDETTGIGEAKTTLSVVGGKLISTAFFNFSDDGGDNFVIKVVLVKAGDDLCQDQSGCLTVWRKRFVTASAMAKQNDDVQVHNVGANVGPGVVCINNGANGISDTTVLGNDDIKGSLSVVESGADGICDTTANSGGNSFYPGGNVAQLQGTLSTAFANSDPNRNCYIDVIASDGKLNMTWCTQIMFADLSQYLKTELHPTSNAHPDNTYWLSGAAHIEAGKGISVHDPHSVVGVNACLRSQSPGNDDVSYTAVHELGHVLYPENLNFDSDTHSSTPNDECCGWQGIGHGIKWCPKHARVIRRNVTRKWDAHDVAATNPGETERDSD